jgi:hypothetical protein
MEREAINNNDVSIESEQEKEKGNGWKYSFLRLMADDDSIGWRRQEPVLVAEVNPICEQP